MHLDNPSWRARTIAALKRSVKKIDIWVQDHCLILVIGLVAAGVCSTGLLLLWKWAQVITLAKQLAPVLTIISILVSALLGAMRWFRKRRSRRLNGLGETV